MPKRQGMIQSTVILFFSMAITKIVNAALKIPLANIIGGIGMGYFSTAYSLFMPIYSLLISGMPTVITRLVAQNAAIQSYKNVRKIKRTALYLLSVTGFGGSLIILFLAKPFASFIADSPDSFLSIAVIAPTLFICSIGLVYRGYYEGLWNMYPTAISQVIESVVKSGFGLVFSFFALKWGIIQFGSVEKALPYAAAAAVFAVTLSELAGTGFLFIRNRLGDGIKKSEIKNSPPPQKTIEIIKTLIKESLPISIGSVITNLGSFIDLITIPLCVNLSYVQQPAYWLSAFSYGDTFGIKPSELGNFIYGTYTGIVSTLYSIIPAMAFLITKSALPNIAAAWHQKDTDTMRKHLVILFRGSFTIGLPLGFGLAALSQPILDLLYSSKPREVAISTLPLTIYGLFGITLTVAGALFCVFQVIGRSDIPIKLMCVGCVIKLLLNIFLIPIPTLNAGGAAVSTVVCYFIVSIVGIILLKKYTKLKIGFFKIFAKPFLAAAASGGSIYFSYMYFKSSLSQNLSLLISCVFGGFIFIMITLISEKNAILNVFSRIKQKRKA